MVLLLFGVYLIKDLYKDLDVSRTAFVKQYPQMEELLWQWQFIQMIEYYGL